MNMHQRISVQVKQNPSALDRSDACETPYGYNPAAGPIDEHAARVSYPLLSFIFFPCRLGDLARQACLTSHAPIFLPPQCDPRLYNLASVHGSSLIPATSQHSEIEQAEEEMEVAARRPRVLAEIDPHSEWVRGPEFDTLVVDVTGASGNRCRLGSISFY
jgi:hypothetical protein